jgi:hypothetical protein
MKRNLTLLIAGLLATGLIAAGCGDDDDDDGDGGDVLTKQEFITQADALCTREGQAVDEAERQQLGQNSSEAEAEEFITGTALPNIQGQIDGIRDLGAPEGEEDQVNAFLDEAQRALDAAEADPSLFAGEQGQDPFAKTRQLAMDLGLKKCAQ